MQYYLEDPRLLPRVLSGYARIALEDEPQNNEFLLEDLFPNQFNATLEYEIDQGSIRTFSQSMGFRAFDAEPGVSGRIGYKTKRGKLPPLGEYKVLLEQETQRIIEGSVTPKALEETYRDVEALTRSARNTMEIVRAGCLLTGTADLGGDLTGIQVDFGRKAGRAPTITTTWDSAAAPALNEERAIWRAIRDEEGVGPTEAWATPEVVDALRTNTDYLEATTDIRVPTEISLAQINDVRARRELPPIREYEQKIIYPGQSVEQRVLSPKHLFYTTGQVGETQWGRPVDASVPDLQIEADLGGPVIYMVQTDHTPIQMRTYYSAIGLPMMGDPDRTAAIQVLP
jgi:hypothetical protein